MFRQYLRPERRFENAEQLRPRSCRTQHRRAPA
jgi:hypothetical protein